MDGNLIEALMGMGSWAAAGLFGIAACALAGLKKQENIAWEDMGIKNANDEHPRLIAKRKTVQGITYIFWVPDGIDMTRLVERYGDKAGKQYPLIKATFGNWEECDVKILDGHRLAISTYADSLPDMCKFDVKALLANSTSPMHVPIGMSHRGIVYLDVGDNAPHCGWAGTNGSGKTSGLRTALLFWVLHPTPVDIYYCDLKGGVDGKTFERCERVKMFAKDPRDVAPIVEHLLSEMKDRLQKFYDAGCTNIDHYNKRTGNDMRRIMFVMDEFADLEHVDGVLENLTEIGRKARATGIHTFPSTQYPTSRIMQSDYKANVPVWFAYKCRSHTESMVILGHGGAEKLPGKGRCIASLPGGEIEMQGFYISPDECEALIKHTYIDKPKQAALNTSGWEE